MAGEPMKVPPPGYAEPPPSYQASMQGFQPTPGYPPPGTQPPTTARICSVSSSSGQCSSWRPCALCGVAPAGHGCAHRGGQRLLTWLLSGACVLFGCWLGCCLIPCCIPECQDVDHHCPSCKRHLCTYRRL
ncbi:hypothetical protein MTO96_031335 [Rhipicephalus appendiculatus]